MTSSSMLIAEGVGLPRSGEPVTVGVPFEKGSFTFNFSPLAQREAAAFSLLDADGKPVPVQAEVLDRWSDGSVRWLLLDFQANAAAKETAGWVFSFSPRPAEDAAGAAPFRQIKTAISGDEITVDTGAAVFRVDSRCFRPFVSVVAGGAFEPVECIEAQQSYTVLCDGGGAEFFPFIKSCRFETQGPLRTALFMHGAFLPRHEKRGPEPIASNVLADDVLFFARIHFYAGHSFAKIEFSIMNPRAAKHPGGMWDLGDENSIFFKDLSVTVGVRESGPLSAAWKIRPGGPLEHALQKDIVIYQDSSGGENWQSRNHVNREGVVTTSFRGYRVFTGGGEILEEGDRADPVLFAGSGGKNAIGAALPQFWQNFPKALEVHGNCLSVRLFPGRCRDIFELQAGERKTHVFFLSFGKAESSFYDGLDWTHAQILPRLAPGYYARTGAFLFSFPGHRSSAPAAYDGYLSLMDGIVEGEKNFFSRREIIDEYGWRNFGDLYADHENAYYGGQKPVISHYNNQYDAVQGFLLQYARSGDPRWFELARDLARHVTDIDIYHTEKDKAAYNGGLFWHTDHYAGAETATHRTYSARTKAARGLKDYGGGPSNEHNYTSGLLNYYFMTGDRAAMEAVTGLADWVVNMDDGSKSPLRFLCRGATGLASRTRMADYHGPGRGCGNSINALLDAVALAGDKSEGKDKKKYLDKAEELIRRCFHPGDDIESLDLTADPEGRWSYTAFLQVIGRYLDFKSERGQHDYMFRYAHEGLLRYAWWMAENEVPFKKVLGRVEYPTETWIVMDMRKSHVFGFAARYETDSKRRKRFIERAAFFYETCLGDLREFETRTLTRPLVLLMSYGLMAGDFYRGEIEAVRDDCAPQFSSPARFVPQRARARRRLLAMGFLGMACFAFLAAWIFLFLK